MKSSNALAVLVGLWLTATLHAQGALIDGRLATEPTRDTLFVARWAVEHAGNHWHLDIGPNHRYRLWRIEGGGDTLVASMGEWSVQLLPLASGNERADHVCLIPINREPYCGRIRMDDLGYPHGYRWQFIDVRHVEMSWVGYRDGRAPWQLQGPRHAAGPVLSLNEVTVRPRLFRCPDPPTFAEHEDAPERVTVELVVEIDSSASEIRVLDAPNVAVRRRVEDGLKTCQFVPGTLDDRPVRVLVRMPVPLRRGS